MCSDSARINQCNTDTLDYTCTCTDGTTPDLSLVTQTIPYFECQQAKSDCVTGNPNDVEGQQACASAQCPTVEPSDYAANNAAASTSSASAVQTSLASSAVGVVTSSPLSSAASSVQSSAISSAQEGSSSPRSSTLGTTSSMVTTTSATAEGSDDQTSSSASGGGSAGETWIAGPVLGGVLGLIIIVGVIWIMLRHRKRRRARASESDDEKNQRIDAPRHELQGNGISEMSADSRRHELMSNFNRHELQGDGRYRAELEGQAVQPYWWNPKTSQWER